jgi:hypothetical protein
VTISYYGDEAHAPTQPSRILIFLMVANAVVAMTVLFAWTAVSLYIVEPIAWATWMPVRRGTTFEDLFDYPFVMLWFMPAAGIVGAWLAQKFGHRALALTCVVLPLTLLSLIFGWFYLAPPAYL